MFPYDYVLPQNDVGGQPNLNLVVYVPTEYDVQYVNKNKFTNFTSVSVYRHEYDPKIESRAPKKNNYATVVYWNPIMPVTEVGLGETRVFSVLLTNDLFYCNTMIVDHNTPVCPVEMHTGIEYKSMIAIDGETPLFHAQTLLNSEKNNFLICFNRETSTILKILNLKRIFCIFEYRDSPARYAINLPDNEVDSLYNKLTWERARRLMKGDIPNKCVHVNRKSLQYLKTAQDMLGIKDYQQSVVTFVRTFQPLILTHQIVPDIIIGLNTLHKQKRVRLYCKNDSYAITSYGVVPNNMPDDNVIPFDYSDVNNNKNLYTIKTKFFNDSNVEHVTITAARYNYYL